MSFEDLESGRPLTSFNGTHLQHRQQDPSQSVAAGVFQINTAVASFQRLVNSLGTPKDTLELRQKLHKTRLHIGQLVKDASAKLKEASETDQHTEVSASKKIADAKLAKDFHNASSELDIDSSRSSEQFALLVESKRQEVVMLENESVFNEAIIEEREQGIKEIQQQIGEVSEIFKDLAVLVHEQGVMIDDISSNIDSSHARTAQATSHLAKASKTQKSNSSLTCLLLLIFGIILIIVIIVVVA
ncbi:hypothetical protein ACSBR1_008834 [Camellia fascicularis]